MNTAGYNFIVTLPGKYEFYTNFGAAYSVYFTSGSSYFSTRHPVKDFIYSVDITLLNPGPYNFYDYIIGITIAEIILHFFSSDNRKIIFYICDPKDGRMAVRNRKFDFWFDLYNSGSFKKIDSLIHTKNISVNLIFIFDKDNPFAYDIPELIKQANDNFNDK